MSIPADSAAHEHQASPGGHAVRVTFGPRPTLWLQKSHLASSPRSFFSVPAQPATTKKSLLPAILLVPFEHRLLFCNKSLVGATKILGRHANSLRLRFRFNGFVQPHVPFL